jgi:hypothetical protein
MLLTRPEFDRAHIREGWRCELQIGVLVVSPTPSRQEHHPNEELSDSLGEYQEGHPRGSSLELTLPEAEIRTKKNRRRVDRAIWAGLGRDLEEGETPTIVVEFDSEAKFNPEWDYVAAVRVSGDRCAGVLGHRTLPPAVDCAIHR